MSAHIALRQFSVKYPEFALSPLSLEFHPGERIAFVGPNGSGKTTTLRALAGRLTAYNGSVLFDGHELRTLLPIGRQRIGLLPETLQGYGWMTVREHLAFLRGFYPSWDSAYAAQLATQLRVPLDQLLGGLSKGTRVKVSFIAAEAYRPPLLLLDEPTSGLDPEVRGELIAAILAAARERPDRVVLFSTHVLEDVELIAERVLLLDKGKLTMDATIVEIRESHRDVSIARALYDLLARSRGHQ